MEIQPDKQPAKIAFKLVVEMTFLLTVLFYFLLAAETILPGFISARLSLVYPAILIIFSFSLANYLGTKISVSYENKLGGRAFILIGSIFFLPLIFVSLFNFGLINALLITFCSFFVFYLFYQGLFAEKTDS